MANRTNATLNLICSVIWLSISSINFASDKYGLGILNLILSIIFVILFTRKIEFKKEEDDEEMLEIARYEYDYKKGKYLVYLIENEEDENVTDFYIQKKGYGNISHTIGFNIDELETDIDEYIKDNLKEWVDICLSDIEKLEQ